MRRTFNISRAQSAIVKQQRPLLHSRRTSLTLSYQQAASLSILPAFLRRSDPTSVAAAHAQDAAAAALHASHASQSTAPYIPLVSASAWSTSIVNTGNPIPDAFPDSTSLPLPPSPPPNKQTELQEEFDRLVAVTNWSTSIVNTGNPFNLKDYYEDDVLKSPEASGDGKVQPAFESIVDSPSWSTSIVNTGNPIPDTFNLEEEGFVKEILPTQAQQQQQTSKTMASDEDYAAFLEKATAPTSDGGVSAQGKESGFTSKTVDKTEVPQVLLQVESVYMSEADEEFEPVNLSWSGKGDLAVDSFAKLIDQKASSVTSISTKEFDPRGQYGDVVDAVKSAGSTGNVHVFRLELSGARCEYWVVSVDEKKKTVVGMKAGAVES